MPDSSLILRAIAIGAPGFTAILVAAFRWQVRAFGVAAAAVSVLASAFLLRLAPPGAPLGESLMLLYSCLAVVAMLVLPRRDCTPGTSAGMLFVLSSTLLAYSTGNLLVLLAAWILTTIPFFMARLFRAPSWRPRVGLVISSIALALAIGVMALNSHGVDIARLKGQSPGGMAVFGLLVAAVIFRKGICPAHAWVADATEGGPAIPTALLLNGHFGAFRIGVVDGLGVVAEGLLSEALGEAAFECALRPGVAVGV